MLSSSSPTQLSVKMIRIADAIANAVLIYRLRARVLLNALWTAAAHVTAAEKLKENLRNTGSIKSTACRWPENSSPNTKNFQEPLLMIILNIILMSSGIISM